MIESRSVTVRVPASTANLGPGFDCLGLALDIWNEIKIQIAGQEIFIQIEGEGADILPIDRDNLILQAFTRFYQKAGLSIPPGIELHCVNRIPISSGLGSSSSAVIAGLLAARQLSGVEISDQELLSLAVEFEGHADNAAACLSGGLVITIQNSDQWQVENIPIQPLKVVIALPEVRLSTHQARKVLPDAVSRQDAVFNAGRTALLIHALKDGKTDLLSAAMQDRLHQSYRLKLIPSAEQAIQAACEAGAFSAALSGAGPGVIAFTDNHQQEIGQAMQLAFSRKNLHARILHAYTSIKGAEID